MFEVMRDLRPGGILTRHSYYHEDRTHLGLAKRTPGGREAEKNSEGQHRVVSMPSLGGLHHRYDLVA
jgi:hypothetical protein